jgi:hypothetical protein
MMELDADLAVVSTSQIESDKGVSDAMLGVFADMGNAEGLLLTSPTTGRVVQYTRYGTNWVETDSVLITGGPSRLSMVWYPLAAPPVGLAVGLRDAGSIAVGALGGAEGAVLHQPSSWYGTPDDPIAHDAHSDLDGDGTIELVVATPAHGVWITWGAW